MADVDDERFDPRAAPLPAPDDDHWQIGAQAAIALRFSSGLRELLLRQSARYWTADMLAGFLHGHEWALKLNKCTCGTSCPVHHEAPVTGAN